MSFKESTTQLWSKLANRERNLSILALVIIFFLMADKLLITPYQDKIASLDRDLKFKHKQLAWYKTTIANAQPIENQFKKYEPFFKATLGSTEDSQAIILADIENRARKNGVQLVDVSPHDAEDREIYLLFNIDLEVIGEPEKIIAFLHSLTRGVELITTESIELRPVKRSKNWRASISVSKAFKKIKQSL